MSVLDTLTPREKKVLSLRFGLEDGRQRTLEEVGQEFNVTRERIRQIEAKALRKLRHPSRSKKLKDYLEKTGMMPVASPTNLWKSHCFEAESEALQRDFQSKPA